MTINCKGNLIDLSVPKVMGILNTTPDSFFDGGKYKDAKKALQQVEFMLSEGATFIDVGAYSSRPKATHISEEEELQRILPMVDLLLKEFPDVLLSIDTFRSKVAHECLLRGSALINDISGGSLDEEMLATIAKHRVPYIIMHMKGTPQTMHTQTNYVNLIQEIRYYFSKKVAAARSLGINDLIIDPGFGFAKTMGQNFELLQNLDLFHMLELPILVGLSRKSMIHKTLGKDAEGALNGTTVLHTFALQKGAHILRVHDVREAMESIKLIERLKM